MERLIIGIPEEFNNKQVQLLLSEITENENKMIVSCQICQ